MKKIKCAIYVRKSTEKGLEQEFNSLHNQEEACKNYILSQAFNNWEHYKTFEDGGISGGTMVRPALQEMMKEIERGNINTVIVYKLDRLSRSILDFHNMMKVFEKHDCNFVSITQAFDTSNSMGKLTLNMLLSFAQFEREISSERVKDKIANSKKKGLWTGGQPKLGYDIKEKKLVINPVESIQIKQIFEEYLNQPSLSALSQYLKEKGIKTKLWKTEKGEIRGGKTFSSSAIHRLLKEQVYIGKIEDKKSKQIFNGVHKAIISNELFQQVQDKLKQNSSGGKQNKHNINYPLKDIIKNAIDENFKTVYNMKNNIIRRYYHLNGNYLNAGNIETLCKDLSIKLGKEKPEELFEKIIFDEDKFIFYINKQNPHLNERLLENSNIKFKESLCEKFIIIKEEISKGNRNIGEEFLTINELNKNIIKALSYAWRYKRLFENGMSIEAIRKQENISHRKCQRYLDLIYLSPKIIGSLLEGINPNNLSIDNLAKISQTSENFKLQEKLFLK